MSLLTSIIAQRNRSSMEVDAAAYVAALISAGATVSGTQKSALNDFYLAEKAAGRWGVAVKRLYLPIWGGATANAIDMVTRIPGTFGGSITHTSSSIIGDGSSGYFAPDSGAATGTLGMVNGDCHLMTLFLAHASETKYCGFRDSATGRFRWQTGTTRRLYLPSSTLQVSTTSTTGLGVFVGSMNAINERHIYWRNSTSFVDDLDTVSASTTITNLVPYALASNNNGSAIDSYSGVTIGGFGFGMKLDSSAASDYTSNLKTLWQTCTGLTLP